MSSSSERPYPYHPVKIVVAVLLGLAAGIAGFSGAKNTPSSSISTPTAIQTPKPTPPTPAKTQIPSFETPAGTVPAGTVNLKGKATPNTQLKLLQDGKERGSFAMADGDGNWTTNLELAAGKYRFEVAQVDATGKVTSTSTPLELSVGAAATPPTSTPTPDLPPATSGVLSFSNPLEGAVLDEGEISFSGKAAPNADLELFDGDTRLSKIKADASGAWNFKTIPSRVGDFSYKVVSGTESQLISVTVRPRGLAKGALIPCPCNLHISTIPSKAVVTVFKDGKELERQKGPKTLFLNYTEGSYTYNVYVRGYKAYDGAFTLPKNRAISVYLDKR